MGAISGAALLYVIASGRSGFSAGPTGFASNGFGIRSPGGYDIGAALLTEIVLSMFFMVVILAVTGPSAPAYVAAPAIGLCLLIIHLTSIPVTNTSVNPARSIGPALFAGSAALSQLWLFVLAPVAGAALVGVGWRMLGTDSNRR